MIFALTSTGCALNVKREAPMTNVNWRVGLEDATLLHGTASLPNEFDMDIGSDLGEWLIGITFQGATGGAGIIESIFDFAFGWLSK